MRLLHTMLRVNDLEESLRFYCEALGMRLLRRKDYPGGRFTLAFVGYGPEDRETVLELTWNWDTKSYDIGTGYGHVALGVEGIHRAVEELRASGSSGTGQATIASRSPSAIARAASVSVAGRITTNSSPPNRAATSPGLSRAPITCPTSAMVRLPTRWPCRSTSVLSPSRS